MLRFLKNLIAERNSAEIRRNSRGVYTLHPRSNSQDRLFISVRIPYPSFGGQPLFVLSRSNWHCQYQSTARPNPIRPDMTPLSAYISNPLTIITGLSGSLEPFQLRIFFDKRSGFTGWRWAATDAVSIFITDSISDDSQSTIDLAGSDKWYEAESFDERILLRGDCKFGPHETDEDINRRQHNR